ncbi:hypothetical protein U9M48_036460 [Paspalum notatum var. saurae]|uniref:Uncharacterized protein n=1 Tax=Paspalum notatum var. saurae TaxID=547442 RepID=A0AAQ3X9J2_PASNO
MREGDEWAEIRPVELTRSLFPESEHQEDDPEDPEYLPEENTDEQDLGDDEPDNIVTRDDWYED